MLLKLRGRVQSNPRSNGRSHRHTHKVCLVKHAAKQEVEQILQGQAGLHTTRRRALWHKHERRV